MTHFTAGDRVYIGPFVLTARRTERSLLVIGPRGEELYCNLVTDQDRVSVIRANMTPALMIRDVVPVVNPAPPAELTNGDGANVTGGQE